LKDPKEPGVSDLKDPKDPGVSDLKDPKDPGVSDLKDPKDPGASDLQDPKDPGVSDLKDPKDPGASDLQDPKDPGWKVSYAVAEQGTNVHCATKSDDLATVQRAVTQGLGHDDLLVANQDVRTCSEIYGDLWALSEGWRAEVDVAQATGVPVIAAAGNPVGHACDPEASVSSPGSSNGALTIGAMLPDATLAPYSGRGPNPEDAVKPLVLGPTNNVTARALWAGDPGLGWVFKGTSAATPAVGGLATLVLDLMNATVGLAGDDTAGRLYATLLAFGTPLDGDLGAPPNNDEGSGLAVAGSPYCSPWFWGSTTVANSTIEIPIPLTLSGASEVRVASWHTDVLSGTTHAGHKRIDLQLRRGDVVHAAGTPAQTPFRVLRLTDLAGGTWDLRLLPISSAGTRRVHFFVHAKLPQVAFSIQG
jgi:hypothetical protein